MLDFHSQILNNDSTALDLARAAITAGFTKLVATSDFTYGKDSITSMEENERKCQDLNRKLKENNIDIEILFGNEINYSPEVVDLLKTSKISPINGSKYILLNLHEEECNFYYIIETAFKLQVAGYIPIISQIEKYDCIIENPSLVRDLIRRDILLQLDILSITGTYGEKVKKTAKALLKGNLIHTLGTNTEKSEDYKSIQTALKKIKSIVGKKNFLEITQTNGESIFKDEELQSRNKGEVKKNLFKFKLV